MANSAWASASASAGRARVQACSCHIQKTSPRGLTSPTPTRNLPWPQKEPQHEALNLVPCMVECLLTAHEGLLLAQSPGQQPAAQHPSTSTFTWHIHPSSITEAPGRLRRQTLLPSSSCLHSLTHICRCCPCIGAEMQAVPLAQLQNLLPLHPSHLCPSGCGH